MSVEHWYVNTTQRKKIIEEKNPKQTSNTNQKQTPNTVKHAAASKY